MVKCSPLRDIETQKRMHRNDWPIGKAAGWQSYFKEKSFYFFFFLVVLLIDYFKRVDFPVCFEVKCMLCSKEANSTSLWNLLAVSVVQMERC